MQKTVLLQNRVWPIIDTYKTAKIHSVTSRAVDIIKAVHYIHGPLCDRRNFCCFLCVSYRLYTIL